MAESFFGVLKRERVNRQHDRTRAEARADIFDYIERSHTPRQRLDMHQQQERLLPQPSVISGVNPRNEKLRWLRHERLSAFYYVSHAQFLFAFSDPVRMDMVRGLIRRVGVPVNRIEGQY